MRFSIRVMGVWPLLCALAVADEPRDYASFLHELADLDRLPLLEEGVVAKQVSSYDRASKYDATTDTYVSWDANRDSGNYLRIDPKTGEAIMLQLAHPGCITRIWSANPQGKIRFYLDGAKTPLEFEFEQLFSGKLGAPFVSPLVWQRKVAFPGDNNPAGVSYVPIPFAKSIKVTADKWYDQQYAIGYKIFPDNARVPTFRLPLSAEEQKSIEAPASAWNQIGHEPQPKAINAKRVATPVELPIGKEVILTTFDGPWTIDYLDAKLESADKWAGRKVLLKIFWDGEEQPSVEAPLMDFFGASFGEKPYQSRPIGITKDGVGYCYWRMPFRKSARLVVINEGEQPAMIQYAVWGTDGAVPPNAGYFHAKWRRERECRSFDYPILDVKGSGKFVGCALFVDNLVGGWWGEGDEKAWMDGEKFPSTFGVSTDGFFNQGGNSLRTVDHPLFGAQDNGRTVAAYRWQIPDAISFEKSFRFTIENVKWLEKTKNDYASVAYWYAAAGATDFFAPTKVADRLPQPARIEKDVFEAEQIAPLGATIVEDEALSRGKAVALSGKKGKRLPLTVTLATDDRYAVELGLGPKTNPAAFELLSASDNRPIGDKIELPAGKNTFVARLTHNVPADAPVVIDFLRIGPWRNFVRDWMIIGPFDNTGDKKFDESYPPETELMFDKTYEGKGGAKVGWKLVRTGLNGQVNFLELLPEPHNDTIAYAAATLISPDNRAAEILLCSDDGIKVWLNGKLVHNNHVHRGAAPDQDSVRVKLNAGANTLLVKVDQGGGDWKFYLRLAEEDARLQFALPQPTPVTK